MRVGERADLGVDLLLGALLDDAVLLDRHGQGVSVDGPGAHEGVADQDSSFLLLAEELVELVTRQESAADRDLAEAVLGVHLLGVHDQELALVEEALAEREGAQGEVVLLLEVEGALELVSGHVSLADQELAQELDADLRFAGGGVGGGAGHEGHTARRVLSKSSVVKGF